MNTPTHDPLPLSEERLMKYGFTPEQYIPGARGFELLVHQARLAIKLKEENDALRKAGEEMAKLLFSFYMRTDYEEPDKNDRDTIQESLNDWRKVAGDAE